MGITENSEQQNNQNEETSQSGRILRKWRQQSLVTWFI